MLKFGKQSSLKQKWEVSLKSSSLFVRNHVSKIVLIKNQQKQKTKQKQTKKQINSSTNLCPSPPETPPLSCLPPFRPCHTCPCSCLPAPPLPYSFPSLSLPSPYPLSCPVSPVLSLTRILSSHLAPSLPLPVLPCPTCTGYGIGMDAGADYGTGRE